MWGVGRAGARCTIIESMIAKRPLIIGFPGHAMVCVGAHYEVDADSGRETIEAIRVHEPSPGNPRLRDLDPDELDSVDLVMEVGVREGRFYRD